MGAGGIPVWDWDDRLVEDWVWEASGKAAWEASKKQPKKR